MTSRAGPGGVWIQVQLAHLFAAEIPADVARFDNEALRDYAQAQLGEGFSVQSLADHLDLDRKFTGTLLDGSRQPSLGTYARILVRTGQPVGSFLRGLATSPLQAEQYTR